MSVRLRAAFDSASGAERARAAVTAAGGSVTRLRGPVPPHELASSSVGRWVLGGGLAGFGLGWALTVGTALAWPIRVGGKPIVSWPAFFVIAFESTILLAALSGLLGFLRTAGLPGRVGADYRPEAGVDCFELTIHCDPETQDTVQAALVAAGASVERVSA